MKRETFSDICGSKTLFFKNIFKLINGKIKVKVFNRKKKSLLQTTLSCLEHLVLRDKENIDY